MYPRGVDRAITGYGWDDAGDPFAALACGHRQHVRHRPPFWNRPWVETEEGRAEHLGLALDCVRCDRLELPDGFERYDRTRQFTETTMPGALRRDHRTKSGVWGRIVVESGSLLYTIDSLSLSRELTAGEVGIIPPDVPHRVEPMGATSFFVEFLRTNEAQSFGTKPQFSP